VLGSVLLQLSLCGIALSFGQSLRNTNLLYWYRNMQLLAAAVLVTYAAISFSKVPQAQEHISSNWQQILPGLTEIWGEEPTEDEVVALMRSNLIIVGVLEIMQVLLIGVNIWASNRLHLKLKLRHESRPPQQQQAIDTQQLSCFNRYVLVYCFVGVLVHFYWEGEYVIFQQWIGQEGDEHWFLAGWRAYGNVDSRYTSQDSFVVAKETAGALVTGPACIILAWATYEHKPSRDIAAVFATLPELYAVVITFASGLLSGEHRADTDNYLYFWFLYVFITVLRVLACLPILVQSCLHICMCVSYHDSTKSSRVVQQPHAVVEDTEASSGDAHHEEIVEGVFSTPQPHAVVEDMEASSGDAHHEEIVEGVFSTPDDRVIKGVAVDAPSAGSRSMRGRLS